jgi:hypothetical protein
VAAGQVLGGTVTFTGGKRSQQVTNIVVRFVAESRAEAKPGQPPPASQTKPVVPELVVTGAFQTQPGTPHSFPFQFQLPPQLAPEIKGQLDYKLTASVDIPGEADAHAVADLQVLGGMAPAMPKMGPMLGIGARVTAAHPMGGWHPGTIVAEQAGNFGVDWDDAKLGQSTWVPSQQVQASQGMPAMPAMPPMPSAPVGIGSTVTAQHPMGGWHPGQIVAAQNGMFGVDWHDPKLGQSTWVRADQVSAK